MELSNFPFTESAYNVASHFSSEELSLIGERITKQYGNNVENDFINDLFDNNSDLVCEMAGAYKLSVFGCDDLHRAAAAVCDFILCNCIDVSELVENEDFDAEQLAIEFIHNLEELDNDYTHLLQDILDRVTDYYSDFLKAMKKYADAEKATHKNNRREIIEYLRCEFNDICNCFDD